MPIRLIHSADWQLEKPFRRFGPEKGAQLRQARLEIIPGLAQLARDEDAQHILVAGDVWDQEVPSDRGLIQPLARMAEAADITFWLLPGNHDPLREESLWDRLRRVGLPGNVRILAEAAPTPLSREVILLPAPWTSKRPGKDLTAWYDTADTPPGAIRVGVAHGGVQSFGSRSDDTAVIDPERARKAGLAYLALGDWHGTRPAGPATWYAGTPEPDGFRSNDQGNALVVDLRSGSDPQIRRTGRFDWHKADLAFSSGEPWEAVLEKLFVPGRAIDRALFDLTLTGSLGLEEQAGLLAKIEENTARAFHVDADLSALRILASQDDLEARLGDGVLRRVAERLNGMRDGPEAEDASEALRTLNTLIGA